MSLTKVLSVALALLVSAVLFVGCSADDLQKTCESMGNIGKAGMGTAGETLVNDAVETVEAFIANYEFCFRYHDPLFVVEDETEKADSMPLKTEDGEGYDGAKGLRDLAASVVVEIGKATQTSTSDKALREALAKPYPESGKTNGRPVFRRFGDALDGSLTGSGIISMMTMLATTDGIGLMENITNYIVPIPIQAYDTLPILDKALGLAGNIIQLVQYNKEHPKPEPSPGGDGFDYSVLLAIPEGIESHTGDRKTQTIGDKISIALLYDVMDAANTVFADYNSSHHVDPENEYSAVDYSEFGFKWIMANCGALLDRAVADINTIGYINGTHIDAAGIIGSYVSGL